MVAYCCAFGCRNERTPGKNISFHRFPISRPDVLELWLHAVRKENFKPTVNTVICSDHFTQDNYLESYGGRKLLKKNAVPSIFKFSGHLKEEAAPQTGQTISRNNYLESYGSRKLLENNAVPSISTFSGRLKEEADLQTGQTISGNNYLESDGSRELLENNAVPLNFTFSGHLKEEADLQTGQTISGKNSLESYDSRELLENNAVPLNFTFSGHLKEEADLQTGRTISICSGTDSGPNTMTANSFKVDPEINSNSPTTCDIGTQTTTNLLRVTPPKLNRYRRKIKTLQQKISLKTKKIIYMQELIRFLKEN